MKLNKKSVLPVIILLVSVTIFIGLRVTSPQPTPTEVQERVWRVEVQEVALQTLAPTLTLYGQVETPSLLNAAAPGNAVVEQVLVKEGEFVKRGQLLIKLDERDFLPRLEQNRAEVAELKAGLLSEKNRHESNLKSLAHEQDLLALAQASVRRAERLQKQKLGSDSALDEARQAAANRALAVTLRKYNIQDHEARVQQLEARLQRAKASLEEVQLDFERSSFKAPFDGIIAQVSVANGDRMRESDVMLKMYALESLEVRARIPTPYQEELQRALTRGQAVVGSVRLGSKTIRLRLDRISGEADPSGVDGLFKIEQGVELLRLGQVGRFQLRRPAQTSVVAIPYQSLYGGNRLYVLEEERMQGLDVEPLGEYINDDGEEQLLIRSDSLKTGDLIITTHLPNAISGLRAEVVR